MWFAYARSVLPFIALPGIRYFFLVEAVGDVDVAFDSEDIFERACVGLEGRHLQLSGLRRSRRRGILRVGLRLLQATRLLILKRLLLLLLLPSVLRVQQCGGIDQDLGWRHLRAIVVSLAWVDGVLLRLALGWEAKAVVRLGGST